VPPPSRATERSRASIGARAESQLRELSSAGWLFGLLLASSFVLGMASRFDDSPWSEVAIVAFDLVLVAFFAVQLGPELWAMLRPSVGERGQWLRSCAVAAVFVPTMWAYFAALEGLGVPMLSMTDDYVKQGWPPWAMLLMVSIAPAVTEEIAFRGVIQLRLERVFPAREAWLIQAALFSVLHLLPIVFPSHFVMGLCFGWMRMHTRSLYPGMLLHAVWNALVLAQELT